MSVLGAIKRLFLYQFREDGSGFILNKEEKPVYDVRTEKNPKRDEKIFSDIEKNREYLEKRFSYKTNDDLVIREVTLNGDTKSFLVFFDGMCKSDEINDGIIKQLLEIPLFGK